MATKTEEPRVITSTVHIYREVTQNQLPVKKFTVIQAKIPAKSEKGKKNLPLNTPKASCPPLPPLHMLFIYLEIITNVI